VTHAVCRFGLHRKGLGHTRILCQNAIPLRNPNRRLARLLLHTEKVAADRLRQGGPGKQLLSTDIYHQLIKPKEVYAQNRETYIRQ
jgi:hypothetical protein